MIISETNSIEFKSQWRDDFLKVVCAFANTEGGIIYIGINDKGQATGIEDYKELLEILPNKIFSKLGVLPLISLDSYNLTNVIKINVIKSPSPVSLNGHFYIRSGSVVLELQGNKLSDFLLKKSGNTWDELTIDNVGIQDIDLETIERFKSFSLDRLPSIIGDKPLEILRKLNLIDGELFKRAAILLFGDNTQKYYPQAHIRIGKF